MEQSEFGMSMTMRDYLRVLFRQKLVVLTCVITVMVTVLIGLQLRTPVYEAQVKMLVSAEKQLDSPYYRELLGYKENQIALTQSEIVTSRPVLERVVKALGLTKKPLNYEKHFASFLRRRTIDISNFFYEQNLKKYPESIRQGVLYLNAIDSLNKSIKVEPIRDTNMFTISVRDFSPGFAAILANVVSRSYVMFDLEQQLAESQLKYGEKHSTVMQLQDTLSSMTKNLNGETMPTVEAIGPASVKIIEQATIPLQPEGPSKSVIAILAFLMSIFLGAMLAFMFEYLDQTLKSPQDIETVLDMPFLGFIPKRKSGELPYIKDSKDITAYTQSFHTLADQIFLVINDKNFKSVLLTSVDEGEGVTTIIANLGTYLSAAGKNKVLLVDANFRVPALHKAFSVRNDIGLSNVLEGKNLFIEAVVPINDNLSFLPVGKSAHNPLTLLDMHKLSDTFKHAKDRYDIVLVDCANIKDFKDAQLLSSYIDTSILVVHDSKTRRQVAQSALTPFRKNKVNFVGAILNNRSFAIPKAIYDRI